MRNWLQECLKSHQHDQRTVFKPTRLIEIVNLKPKVLLRLRDDANDEGQPYVALSYCWGGPQSLMTTKSTESALKFEFPAKRLPQTIRDAVTVASELGVSYLWVDSICIIQDDEVDKAKEISQMPQVYRNATVTILASRAAGASEGFLHEHPHIEPLDPLYCRGWALQERVLASRAIDFGRLQTRWLCNHGERREGYVDGSSLEDAESFSPWNHLVETYTLRELTLSDDRLLAISGLAERYSGSYQSTYLAGMWHSTLVPDLLWRASMAFRFNGKGSRVHLSPSWSWASVNYSVTFGDSLRLRPPQITLKLIDYQTTLTYANAPFGAVQNGILAVKGRSWSGTLEFKPSGPVRDNSDFTIVEEFAQADEEWSVLQNLDAPEDDLALDNEFNSWPVRLLMISHTFDERSLHCRGLVLHRAIDESNFQRLGTFLLWYPNKIAGEDAVEQDSKVKTSLERKRIKLFDHCKEEIITIV
ncbi:hypothetical protein OIDMADRAFT_173779 [Oidiodendron maius Zn]|uniref:Heterokaryon incompatibility domain-containing protein n=1 Tax=Oidiodendron maius (strain Zn) TaxID=913774 RepID=A0A0C3GQP5_OIDMZ|nr:hypothetical protein OIDMADRAFT_173779 [Oidiodendron maius Zn]